MTWQKRIAQFLTSKSLAAGILGFLLSLFATEILFLVPSDFEIELAGLLLLPIVILMVHIAGLFEASRNHWWNWRRIISPIKVGVLKPFFDESKKGTACKIQFSANSGWLDFFNRIDAEKKQFDVEEINWSDISGKYLIVINPFGEIFLENDKRNFTTYEKIKDFIAEGGIFCCTGGFPFYYFWNEILGKEIDTTPKTRRVDEKLGLIMDPRYFIDSLITQDFGVKIPGFPEKPTLNHSYQEEADKEYFGDLTAVGGFDLVWEFRSISEKTDNAIPGLRIKGKDENRYALAAVPYGKGFIIVTGMAPSAGEVEFKKLTEGLVSFSKLVVKREKTKGQSRYETLVKTASVLKRPSSGVFAYLLVSIALSLLVFLRLNLLTDFWVKEANFVFYFLMYIASSGFAVWYSLITLLNYNKKQANYSRALRIYFAYIAILSVAIFVIIVPLSANGAPIYDWLLLTFPVFLSYSAFVMLKLKTKTISRKRLIQFGTILLVSALLPISSAFVSQEIVITSVSNIHNVNQKVQVIGDLARTNLGSFNFLRSGNDYWKYLLVGTGACYEGAMASCKLLSDAGFETRIIILPGEDHAFAELEINGTWMVIDPGYGFTTPVSRHERANARLNEFGAISYVITCTDSNFTELTSEYVPTDAITIKVTKDGVPLPNAAVYLTHEFQNRTLRLPTTDLSFTTNARGEVLLHMGALTYNQEASQYENCYWIFVDGQKTGHNVTSNGTYENKLITIETGKV